MLYHIVRTVQLGFETQSIYPATLAYITFSEIRIFHLLSTRILRYGLHFLRSNNQWLIFIIKGRLSIHHSYV